MPGRSAGCRSRFRSRMRRFRGRMRRDWRVHRHLRMRCHGVNGLWRMDCCLLMLHGNSWRVRRHLWTRCRGVNGLGCMYCCLRMLHGNRRCVHRIRVGRLRRMGRFRRMLDRGGLRTSRSVFRGWCRDGLWLPGSADSCSRRMRGHTSGQRWPAAKCCGSGGRSMRFGGRACGLCLLGLNHARAMQLRRPRRRGNRWGCRDLAVASSV